MALTIMKCEKTGPSNFSSMTKQNYNLFVVKTSNKLIEKTIMRRSEFGLFNVLK